jgi:hypothetical protein
MRTHFREALVSRQDNTAGSGEIPQSAVYPIAIDDVIQKDCISREVERVRAWLARRGCTFMEGTRQTVVYCKGQSTTLPRHIPKEVAPGTMSSKLRKLGLKVER